MAIQNTRKRSILIKVIEKFNLYYFFLFLEYIIRKFNKEAFVFYRYRWSRYFTHPVFIRNYLKPPVKYSTKNQSKLFHFYHSADKDVGYDKPYIIEPIDHPTCISNNVYTFSFNDAISKTAMILSNGFCHHVILSSSGHKKLFDHYFGDLSLPSSIVYPACIPSKIILTSKLKSNNVRYVSIVSDFELKGLDLIIEAWLKADTNFSELVIICPNVPLNYIKLINSKKNITLYNNVTERKKHHLYQNSDLALIPIHNDGLGVYVEAIENELPIVTYRTVHSKDFLIHNNGIEIEVPYSFYDIDKYGILWNNNDEFRNYLKTSKINDEFSSTRESLISTLNELNLNSDSYLAELKINARSALRKTFLYEHRNKILSDIYNSFNR